MKFTYLALLAVFGVATVSAGFADWFGSSNDHDDEDTDIRERRHADESCSPKTFAKLNTENCCTFTSAITPGTQKTCKELMKKLGRKGRGKGRGKGKIVTPEGVVTPETPATAGAAVVKRSVGKGEKTDCMLQKDGLLTETGEFSDSLYINAFNKVNSNADLQTAAVNAIATCKAEAAASATASGSTKPPCAGKIRMCVDRELFKNCPTAAKANATANCAALVTGLDTCKLFAPHAERGGGKSGEVGERGGAARLAGGGAARLAEAGAKSGGSSKPKGSRKVNKMRASTTS